MQIHINRGHRDEQINHSAEDKLIKKTKNGHAACRTESAWSGLSVPIGGMAGELNEQPEVAGGHRIRVRKIGLTIMILNNLRLIFPYMFAYSIGIYVP